MRTLFALSALSLLLFFSTMEARTGLGEYWRGVKKDQPMPKSIQGIVRFDPVASSVSDHGHTPENSKQKQENPFVRDFKSRLDISIYNFVKDFEPRLDVSIYNNDIQPIEGKSLFRDFKPRPDISIFNNDIKPTEEKSFVKDFEPRLRYFNLS